MPPKKKPAAKSATPKKPVAPTPKKKSTANISVEIVELASSSQGRISRRSGAALERELIDRAPGLPLPADVKVVLPDPTPTRYESTAEAYSYYSNSAVPNILARRSLSNVIGGQGASPPATTTTNPIEDDKRDSLMPPPTSPDLSVGKAARSSGGAPPLSSEAILGLLHAAIPVHSSSNTSSNQFDPVAVREAVKVAEALPSIAQALFLFAKLHWSQIGFSNDASSDRRFDGNNNNNNTLQAQRQQRGNFYVISGSSTERGSGRIASVPPSPGKPIQLLSPPPTPTKGIPPLPPSPQPTSVGISLGGGGVEEAESNKENTNANATHRKESSPSVVVGGSLLGSVPVDERLLGAVGNRCPFVVTKDHVEQAAALFPDQLRTDWSQLNAPRLCFIGCKSSGFTVPSTNTLRSSMESRYPSLQAVAKQIVLVTSASLAASLRKQHGPRSLLLSGSATVAPRAGTADLIASIRKSREDQHVPLVGVDGMGGGPGKLSSRIVAPQGVTMPSPSAAAVSQSARGGGGMSNMRQLLQSVSSALNSQLVGAGSKRPREEVVVEGDDDQSPPSISSSLLAALPQDKLQEVMSAASVEHLYSTHDLSRRLQRQINLERTMVLFDLVCAVFGPTRTSMSGGRLLQQLATQNANGDSKDVIREQLVTLLRLGPQGSGLAATEGSLVGILAGAGVTSTTTAESTVAEQDLSDRLIVLNRIGIDRRMLEHAIDATL